MRPIKLAALSTLSEPSSTCSSRISLHLQVYLPSQVLQINGRLYRLVPASQCCRKIVNSRVPLLPGRYSGSSLIRTHPPPSRLSIHFPLFTVIESTLLREFLPGTRRVSPVARYALVTVLSLPPRRSELAVSISFRLNILPSPYGCGLGLRGISLSGPPVRSLSLRPGDSLTSPKDCFVDGLQVIGFPYTCHPSYRASDSYPGRTYSC
jgi:hypothetical protein